MNGTAAIRSEVPSKRVPPVMITEEVPERFPLPVRERVPPEMDVPPVNVLLPESTSAPLPTLVTPKPPLMPLDVAMLALPPIELVELKVIPPLAMRVEVVRPLLLIRAPLLLIPVPLRVKMFMVSFCPFRSSTPPLFTVAEALSKIWSPPVPVIFAVAPLLTVSNEPRAWTMAVLVFASSKVPKFTVAAMLTLSVLPPMRTIPVFPPVPTATVRRVAPVTVLNAIVPPVAACRVALLSVSVRVPPKVFTPVVLLHPITRLLPLPRLA